MKKLFVIMPALALAVALSGSALAENGSIGNATLNAMGLGGMQVMSDEQAMTVRGKGFLVPGSAALAFGISYATVGNGGIFSPNSAGTADGFLADGTFMASGTQLSTATQTRTTIDILTVKGLPATTTTNIRSLTIGAGGFATSSAF